MWLQIESLGQRVKCKYSSKTSPNDLRFCDEGGLMWTSRFNEVDVKHLNAKSANPLLLLDSSMLHVLRIFFSICVVEQYNPSHFNIPFSQAKIRPITALLLPLHDTKEKKASFTNSHRTILGDPGAARWGGKKIRAKKSQERGEELLLVLDFSSPEFFSRPI